MNDKQEMNHAFARSRSNAGLCVTAREHDALEHIARNGNLLFWRGAGYEAQQIFEKLERDGRIVRNRWSGRWVLTPNAKAVGLDAAGGQSHTSDGLCHTGDK
jgi:hypothetical protein